MPLDLLELLYQPIDQSSIDSIQFLGTTSNPGLCCLIGHGGYKEREKRISCARFWLVTHNLPAYLFLFVPPDMTTNADRSDKRKLSHGQDAWEEQVK